MKIMYSLALPNTNINPLITSYKTAPSNVGSFFNLYTLPKVRGASRTGGYGVQAAQARNFAKAYKRDNQLLLEYVM